MKILKKMLSIFLTAAIMVGTMCVGTISAGAEASSDLFIEFEESGDGSYFVHLKGISAEHFSTAGTSAISTGGSWGAQVVLVTPEGKYHLMCLHNQYKEGTQQLYMYMGGALQLPNGNIENIYGFAYYNTIDKYFKRSESEYWNIYFSIPEDVYKKVSKKTSACAAQLFVFMNDGIMIDIISADPASLKSNETNSSVQSSSTSKKISSLSFSKISNKAYTGKAIKPTVTVKDGNIKLKKGTDYTVTYKNNKNIGTASVTIKGKGNYTGSKTIEFKIVPKKTTLKATKKSDTKVKLTWDKVTNAEKYQIYYSTNGGKYKKLATVSGSKTSYTNSKLDFEKNDYKFKIRAYDKVDGKTYYSSYSKVVAVK